MNPTVHLRHVWRLENDGNGDVKVLALQQWIEFDDGVGWWQDVSISFTESDERPE
jgi:hypothetical protein